MNFPHLAVVEFDCYDSLIPYKQEIIEHYFDSVDDIEGFSVFYNNPVLENNIGPRILQAVKNNFTVDLHDEDVPFHVYVQTNKRFTNVFHTHMLGQRDFIDPSIVGCLYLDPPKNGGALEFCIIPNIENGTIAIPVETNRLYLFPSWLYHRPMPQEDEDERISICFSIRTYNRPVYRAENIVW